MNMIRIVLSRFFAIAGCITAMIAIYTIFKGLATKPYGIDGVKRVLMEMELGRHTPEILPDGAMSFKYVEPGVALIHFSLFCLLPIAFYLLWFTIRIKKENDE